MCVLSAVKEFPHLVQWINAIRLNIGKYTIDQWHQRTNIVSRMKFMQKGYTWGTTIVFLQELE
jgi:hypothetical protein